MQRHTMDKKVLEFRSNVTCRRRTRNTGDHLIEENSLFVMYFAGNEILELISGTLKGKRRIRQKKHLWLGNLRQ